MLSSKVFTDQLGRKVSIPTRPKRIISLVPSQTELLFELGLHDSIVGFTKFCTHPASGTLNKPKIGGTKQLDIELIKSLKPDLIIANKEENERTQVEELMRHFPVWISDINNLPDALTMISDVGEITGRFKEAKEISTRIAASFTLLQPAGKPVSVAYLIWRKPYMLAGQGTFINDMLACCGFVNCTGQMRYPSVVYGVLAAMQPAVVLLSSEPYPFGEKHIPEFRSLLPNAKICLVDGEMFSWYGSRLQYSALYFAEIIKMLDNQP